MHHFWDPKQLIASSYAVHFNWKRIKAWDVYLFFKKGKTWSDPTPPPSPHVWFHQRSGVNEHYDKKVTGWKMRQKLQKIVDEFIKEERSAE